MEAFRRYLADHHGVFSRGHAREFGLTDRQIGRRLHSGEWIRAAPRVFRLATAPCTWEAEARTAALSSRGLISSTAALRTWSVDGHLDRVDLHVLVDHRRAPRARSATLHRGIGVGDEGGHLVSGIPVTGLERAVVDAAALLTVDELDATIDAVIRQGLTTLPALRRQLEQLGTRGRKGAGELKRLVSERLPGRALPDSRFNRLVGQLLVASELPEPTYEFEVRYRGRFVGRADLAYPAANLLVECDSARWHRDRKSFHDDPRRRNRLMLAGYRVLSFTWDDYANRPSELVAVVAAAYHEGGR